MARVLVHPIEDIGFNVIPHERLYNSTGGLSLDRRVREMYEKKQYDTKPKTQHEADIRGEIHFNALVTSAPNLHTYPRNGMNYVTVDLAPTRYLIGQAMRDCVARRKYSDEEIEKMSPDMVGVSLIAPVRIKGKYFLLSQIKGKALGSGEIHTGLVAGNVDQKYLSQRNPLVATLKSECSEELGIDLSYLDSTSFLYLFDERETGQINFASVSRNLNIEQILESYEAMSKNKLQKQEQLEVMALSTLPIASLALTPLEDSSSGLTSITSYRPSEGGLVRVIEDRKARPYSLALVEHLRESDNVRLLLERAGF